MLGNDLYMYMNFYIYNLYYIVYIEFSLKGYGYDFG